jgi:hypothetical protein
MPFFLENLLIEFLNKRLFYKYFRDCIKFSAFKDKDFSTPLEMTVLKAF